MKVDERAIAQLFAGSTCLVKSGFISDTIKINKILNG